jgi:hypothetical protein
VRWFTPTRKVCPYAEKARHTPAQDPGSDLTPGTKEVITSRLPLPTSSDGLRG